MSDDLIAAVLAVTPIHPDGRAITDYERISSFEVDYLRHLWGDPAPIAARQAAAAVRLSAEIVARRTASWPSDQRQIADLVLGMFFGLADETNRQETTDEH